MCDGKRNGCCRVSEPLLLEQDDSYIGPVSCAEKAEKYTNAPRQVVFVYVPLDAVSQVSLALKKTGVAFRINDNQAGAWKAEHILCYLHWSRLSRAHRLLIKNACLQQQQVRVIPLLDYLERYFGLVEVDLLKARHLPALEENAGVYKQPGSDRVRRGVDIILAGFFLLVFAPVGVLIAGLIRLDSSGPVFFRQVRVGLYNREFTIIKFRSMHQGAEKNGPRWAVANDERITRVGAFIRKTRIDELPQLFNVLKGDMALIGPRPERRVFIAKLESEIPFYHLRHLVRPGITGLAQVMFNYGASVEDAREKHRYDLYYIKHCSPGLNFKILWRTLRIVLLGKGV